MKNIVTVVMVVAILSMSSWVTAGSLIYRPKGVHYYENSTPIPAIKNIVKKKVKKKNLPFKTEVQNGMVKIFVPERTDQYLTKNIKERVQNPKWQLSVSYCYYLNGQWIEYAPKGGIEKYRVKTRQPTKKGGYIVGYLRPKFNTKFVWLRIWGNDLNDHDSFTWLWIQQSDNYCRMRKGSPGYEIVVNLKTGEVFNPKTKGFPEFP